MSIFESWKVRDNHFCRDIGRGTVECLTDFGQFADKGFGKVDAEKFSSDSFFRMVYDLLIKLSMIYYNGIMLIYE